MVSLREVRQRQMGIKRLAKLAGVSTQTIVNIEHGRQVPRYDTMNSIAGALGVPTDEIDEFRAAREYWASWQPGSKSPVPRETGDPEASSPESGEEAEES